MSYLIRLARTLGDEIAAMGGYFLLAVLLAAMIKTFKWDKLIRHALQKTKGWSIPLATAAGLLSPLCSCGILPVASSLLVAGVDTAAVMALLITSPVMSPDAFIITWGRLGPSFALAKLFGAAALGLSMGYLVRYLEVKGSPDRTWPGKMMKHHCVDPLDPKDPRRGLAVTINRWRYFALMVGDMTWIIGRYLALALVMEAILVTFVPANLLKVLLGQSPVKSVFLAALVGLPLPLHQVAAVPIVRGLLDLGADRGAAMALLIAGPVSSIPALVYLFGLVNRRLFWIYLSLSLGGSLLIGFLFRLL